jgi:hypothetical protein
MLWKACSASKTPSTIQSPVPEARSLLHGLAGCVARNRCLPAVTLNPALATSWIMLERLYEMMGQDENATAAAGRVSALKQLPPEVVKAGSLFSDGDLSAAEDILRATCAARAM